MTHLNLIYGLRPVQEFLNRHPQLVKSIWAKEPAIWKKIIETKNLKIAVQQRNADELQSFFKEMVNHQGVVAEIKEYQYLPATTLLTEMVNRDQDLLVVLDQVQDAHNFGAIIRTASLLGIKSLVILDRKQVFVTPTVVKTSAGTVYDLTITKVANLSQFLTESKKIGYWIYVSNLNQKAEDLRQVKFSAKSILVLGNEAHGVRQLVTSKGDVNLFIPTLKNIDSLNVSTAAAIILFTMASQLKLV